jgi:hypothetical protein
MCTKMPLHDNSKHRLESNWESPLDLAAGVVEAQADPVATHDSLKRSVDVREKVNRYSQSQSGYRTKSPMALAGEAWRILTDRRERSRSRVH